MNTCKEKSTKAVVPVSNGRLLINPDDNEYLVVDETHLSFAKTINKIHIQTFNHINVIVSKTDDDNIVSHLYGVSLLCYKLCVKYEADTVNISLLPVEKSNHCIDLLTVDTFENKPVTLEVKLPAKKFEKLIVESINADICIEDIDTVKKLVLKSTNGSIKSLADFNSLKLKCINGKAKVSSFTNSDVKLKANLSNAKADIFLENVKNSNLSVTRFNSKLKNNLNSNVFSAFSVYGKVKLFNSSLKLH